MESESLLCTRLNWPDKAGSSSRAFLGPLSPHRGHLPVSTCPASLAP